MDKAWLVRGPNVEHDLAESAPTLPRVKNYRVSRRVGPQDFTSVTRYLPDMHGK